MQIKAQIVAFVGNATKPINNLALKQVYNLLRAKMKTHCQEGQKQWARRTVKTARPSLQLVITRRKAVCAMGMPRVSDDSGNLIKWPSDPVWKTHTCTCDPWPKKQNLVSRASAQKCWVNVVELFWIILLLNQGSWIAYRRVCNVNSGMPKLTLTPAAC